MTKEGPRRMDAAMETLRFVASMPAGSGIVFDYVVSRALLDDRDRAAREPIEKRVAELGEPWLSEFEPAALAAELRQLGFKHVEDLGAAEFNQCYFKGRADGWHVWGVGRIAKAGN